jgi:hypothetical protein
LVRIHLAQPFFEPLAQSVARFVEQLQRQLARKAEGLLSTGFKRNLFRDLFEYEPLAQSVEHLTFNQRVEGSSPSWLTKVFLDRENNFPY